jgi:hypothetical protein
MEFLSFPLRIGRDGRLKRANTPEDAASQLIEIMARTGCEGGWRGVKEFGLRDHMMVVGGSKGLQPEAVQTANRILVDLGIDWFRVNAVDREDAPDPSEAAYRASLLFVGKGIETVKVKVRT